MTLRYKEIPHQERKGIFMTTNSSMNFGLKDPTT